MGASGELCSAGPEYVGSDYVDGGTPDLTADRFDGFQIADGIEEDPESWASLGDGSERGAVRLGSPAEVAAAIPHFFGFQPNTSRSML
jgi:hypothetical protein